MTRVFTDSSALFAAVVSSSGVARELLRLSLAGMITLVISPDVVTETRRNLGRKAPTTLSLFEQLFGALEFEMTADPTFEDVQDAASYVADKDAIITAAARNAAVDHLATFDRAHLIDPPEVGRESGSTIATPGDIFGWIRRPPD